MKVSVCESSFLRTTEYRKAIRINYKPILELNEKCSNFLLYFDIEIYGKNKAGYIRTEGDRRSTVVKVLCYKSEGRCFDSRLFHWNFSLT